MITKFSKYLLAVAFVHIVCETYAVREEHPIEYSRGCHFRESPVYTPLQVKWTDHDTRCVAEGSRKIEGDLPHFNWELVRREEKRDHTAYCDMCGKGMYGRTDTFIWQYYMKHELHAVELLVGADCRDFMEKTITGDDKIRWAIEVIRSYIPPVPGAPRRSGRRR